MPGMGKGGPGGDQGGDLDGMMDEYMMKNGMGGFHRRPKWMIPSHYNQFSIEVT